MDPMTAVSAAASMVQLVDFAARLAIDLYSIAETIGGAEEEINGVALEISLFSNALVQLRLLFERNATNYSSGVMQNTQNVIQSCQDLFRRYEVILGHLCNPDDLPVSSEGLPKAAKLSKTARITWVFKQKRVEVLRRRLAALQTNLLTMLQTLALSELGSLRFTVSENMEKIVTREQKVLRSYVMANRVSISSLRDAEEIAEGATDEPDLTLSTAESSDLVPEEVEDQPHRKKPNLDSLWMSDAIYGNDLATNDETELATEHGPPTNKASIPTAGDLVSRFSVVLEAGSLQPKFKIEKARGEILTARRETFKTTPAAEFLAELPDIPTWLRLLRVHKYTDYLKDMTWAQLLKVDDEFLGNRCVRAVGARRKISKELAEIEKRYFALQNPALMSAQAFMPNHLEGIPWDEVYETLRNADFYDGVSAKIRWVRALGEAEQAALFLELWSASSLSQSKAFFLGHLLQQWHALFLGCKYFDGKAIKALRVNVDAALLGKDFQVK